MSKERKFVPLPEVNSKKINMRVTLPPYIDPYEIGVNVSKIERLEKIGAIKHLRVNGSYDRQQRIVDANVVGVNSSGEAVMGTTATVDNEQMHKDIVKDTDNELIPFFARWASGEINLNMQDIASNLSDSKKFRKKLRSPEGWAYHIDKAMKEGITDIGNKQLIASMNKNDIALALTQNGIGAAFVPTSYQHFEQLGAVDPKLPIMLAVAEQVVFTSFIMTIFYSMRYQSMLSKDGMHPSLIWGPQLDRALILNIAARTGRLVKHIPTEIEAEPGSPTL